MGRERKGHIRERDGKFLVELAGEYLGSFEDEGEATRRLGAALAEDADKVPDAFGEFGARWLEARELAATERKRSKAFDKEASVWGAHIATAEFYDWPLKKLSPKAIQAWVTKLSRKEAVQAIRSGKGTVYRGTGRRVGRRVVENSLKLLKLCLDDAIIEGKIAAPNSARLVKLPREEVSDRDGELIVHLSTDEIKRLFKQPLPPMQRAVFAVAIYSGLRLDELWGLRWQNLLLDGKQPTVRVRFSYNSPCKTPTSRRDVPLLKPAADALRAWRAAQPSTPIGGLVFPGKDNKCHGESFTARWRTKMKRVDGVLVKEPGWAEKAGIRKEVVFHALRHTCGCHLAQGTWTPRPLTLHEIKRWLGHSSIAVTERHYAALTVDNLHRAIAFTGNSPDEDLDVTL